MKTLKSFLQKNKGTTILIALCLIVYYLNYYASHRTISPRMWYKYPLVDFSHLLLISLALFLLAAVTSNLNYVGAILASVFSTMGLIVLVETAYCGLYEWRQRPANIENLAKLQAAENSARSNKSKSKPIRNDNIKFDRATIQGLDTLNFSLSDTNQSSWRKDDPPVSSYQMFDEHYGYKNKPNVDLDVKSWSYGMKNFDVHYTTDSLGRRITGLNTTERAEKKYALFLGCSITFGLFSDNDQTLPAFFEGMDTSYKAYNYGVAGWGTHNILAMLENRNLRNEIPEKDGVAIYTFFIGHVQRSIGDMESYLSWNSSSPYYYESGNTVKRNKNFNDGRKLTSWFYEFISKTYFCKYYHLTFPGELKSYHYELTAKIIEKAFQEYQKQFGNDNFYVVLLPGWDDEMKPYLEKLNLKIIDCKKIVPDYWNEKYHYYGDGHPRPLFFKIVAQRLHEVIDR